MPARTAGLKVADKVKRVIEKPAQTSTTAALSPIRGLTCSVRRHGLTMQQGVTIKMNSPDKTFEPQTLADDLI